MKRTDVERGQVLTSPGSIKAYKKFKAILQPHSEAKDGWKVPTWNGYPLKFSLRTADVSGLIKLPEGVQMIMPGGGSEAEIELSFPIAIDHGTYFTISEGEHIVANGMCNESEKVQDFSREKMVKSDQQQYQSIAKADQRRPSISDPGVEATAQEAMNNPLVSNIISSLQEQLPLILAQSSKQQEANTRAENRYQQHLDALKQRLGPNHPQVSDTLIEMALFYRKTGRYMDAEELCKQALHIREEQQEPNHHDIAVALSWLAMIYCDQKKYSQAVPLRQRQLESMREQRGDDHPETALSMTDLALCYFELQQWQLAEPLFQQALSVHEKNLGVDHLDLERHLVNLEKVYYAQAHYARAEALRRRLLALYERKYGLEHPQTAMCLYNLALLQIKLQRLNEAVPNFQRALNINRKHYGLSHSHTQKCLVGLADLYGQLKYYSQAEPLYLEHIALLRETNAERSSIAPLLNQLCKIEAARGKYAEAERAGQEAFDIYTQSEDAYTGDILDCLLNLRNVYSRGRQSQKIEQTYLRAYTILQKQPLRINDKKYVQAIRNQNYVRTGLMQFGKFAEAEQVGRLTLVLAERYLGADDVNTANCLLNLIWLNRRLMHQEEARKNLQRALGIYELRIASYHRIMLEFLGSFVELHRNILGDKMLWQLLLPLLGLCKRQLGAYHPTINMLYQICPELRKQSV
ncbi:tetratricopeptide repeat protein [Ktedonosporobacter rubrisoli]|uniref:Tetratricopeptide repeat protein n=1 Tax=Ktedonosporobacter rubrisoli TaxID=2509675 RepID=A0A4P6JLX9_KTERU|nr:tetratricopeptide repeat protein [Ktedonosporobacter rubrisoli]QBD76225.1 tetratricopeptide repeat protein [Ktedonosporobacter rubrisoli]